MTLAEATYILPLRSAVAMPREFAAYLEWLAERLDVVVVDGSDDAVFAAHSAQWPAVVRHVEPDPALRCANGKVHGVLTGFGLASHERCIVADDDVRYDAASLERTLVLLERYDLVRPQNYFDPVPWHAAWDTGRSLLNRAFAADYPGTLGVRRSVMRRTGGYDGNVLFENLELMRTVAVAGGTSVAPLDLYVRRLPPTDDHFWGQRVRQAYDEIARPGRMALELSVVPLAAAAVASRRWGRLAAGIATIMAVAEVGRSRGGGTAVFAPRASLFAPLWVGERGICSWLALWARVRHGGVPYAGGILGRAATPRRQLRQRLATRDQGAVAAGDASVPESTAGIGLPTH